MSTWYALQQHKTWYNWEENSKPIQDGTGTEPEPETGTVGTVFPGTERGTGTAGPFSRNRNRNRNRPCLLNSTETQKDPFCRGTEPEPKTGTAWTVPSPNRNRTEPNRGHPGLGATRPATLRAKWHSERGSERAFEKPLKNSQNLSKPLKTSEKITT